ncbi:MAG: radical SAM protein [Azoarcus sp.]|jgi:MoaA/NifB/PqqE/SkfB family radical SAM enzyme|nr:radical SAM protein [Azoarcus sp.]
MLKEPLKMARLIKTIACKGMFHCNVQVHYHCNFKCKICEFWKKSHQSKPSLSVADIRLILEKIRPLGPQSMCLSGGEPLMHPEILDIAAITAREHFVVLICNGWFITPELARELFKTGIYEANISVDYANAAQHDAMRGKEGAFDRAMAALETLFASRCRKDQRVHMNSVLMADNVDQIEELTKICKKIGITHLITFYCGKRGTMQRAQDTKETVRRLLDIKKRYPELVTLPGYIERFAEAGQDGKGVGNCCTGKNLFDIDCQGNISRCLDWRDKPVGNIFHEDTNLLMQRLHEQFVTMPCADCWTSCRGNVEALLYGKNRLRNWRAYYEIIRDVPFTARAQDKPLHA